MNYFSKLKKLIHNKTDSNERKIIRNSFFGMGGSVIGQLIAMGTSIVMARLLGVTSLGAYSFALAYSGFIYIFLNLGLSSILHREASQHPAKTAKYLANTLFIKVVMAIPFSIVITIPVCILIGRQDVMIVMILSCIYSGMASVFSAIESCITAREKFDISFYFSLLQKVSMLGVTGIVLLLIENLIAVMLGYLLVFIILVYMELAYVRKNICRVYFEFDRAFCKDYVKESLPSLLSSAAEYINLKSDSLLLGILLSDVAVGLYSVSSNIYIAASFIPLAIAKSTLPTFNRVLVEDIDEAKRIVNRSIKVVFLVSLIIGISLIVLGRIAIIILYGHEYEEATFSLAILGVSLFAMPLNRLFSYILVGLRKQGIVATATWIGAIVNVLLNMIFIPLYGMNMAAITTFLTELLVTLIEIVFLKKQLKAL